MTKLSDLRPGQKVNFTPVYDKTKQLTGEILDYVFLAVIQMPDGSKSYAHSSDIDVLEQPKQNLSDEIKAAIADQVKEAMAAPATPAAAPAPVPEWDEGTADEKKSEASTSPEGEQTT